MFEGMFGCCPSGRNLIYQTVSRRFNVTWELHTYLSFLSFAKKEHKLEARKKIKSVCHVNSRGSIDADAWVM